MIETPPLTRGGIEDLRKGDIAELRTELKVELAVVNERREMLRTETGHIHDDLVERMRDSRRRF